MAYSVAVSDGWVTDYRGNYVREATKRECGHQHRTVATAEACRERLQATTGKGTKRTTSAAWYDAIILEDGKSRWQQLRKDMQTNPLSTSMTRRA